MSVNQVSTYSESITVHDCHTNMEGNAYWTEYHKWFADALEGLFMSIVPDLRERFKANHLKIKLFDTYIKHIASAFFGDTVNVEIEIGQIDTKRSLIEFLVKFTNEENKIATGWQRVSLVDEKGNKIGVPEDVIRLGSTQSSRKLVGSVRRGKSKKKFEVPKLVSLHHTNTKGETYPTVYLEWLGEAREEFIMDIDPDFIEQFQHGMRTLTHDTYLRHYKSIFFPDTVTIEIQVGKIRLSSARLLFAFVKDGEVIAEGWQTLVFANDKGKPIRIPLNIIRPGLKYLAGI